MKLYEYAFNKELPLCSVVTLLRPYSAPHIHVLIKKADVIVLVFQNKHLFVCVFVNLPHEQT